MSELTPMQAASWSARQGGDVAAHLYVELDGGGGDSPSLDPARLTDAVARLYRRHPMLRMRVSGAGRQMVLPLDPARHSLAVDDLTAMADDPPGIAAALAQTRARMSHQRLDLAAGVSCEFRLTCLPGGRHRLHVDLDMIAADPSCFGRLMDDLARFYGDATADCTHLQPCYLDLLPPPRRDAEDREWWRATLANLPDPLPLPAPAGAPTAGIEAGAGACAQSTSLSARLPPATRRALCAQARAAGVTPAMLALALFARAMAAQTGSEAFRLTVPGFLRPWPQPHGDALVGDFSDISVLSVREAADRPVAALARDLAAQLAGALSHRGWPTIAALRDLSRQRGRVAASPVVFTAGFGLPGGSILTERARAMFGGLGWAVSQGPGVAMDVQLAEDGDGLLLNWDLRLDLVDEDWAAAAFDRYLGALRALTPRKPADARGSAPLGPLQRAYLLGRGDALPLGGVAMQELREYRGTLTVAEITRRLDRLVVAHPALRRVIDADSATSRETADPPQGPLIVDLRHLDPAAADAEIAAGRDGFAHHVDDLSASPWALRLYQLPEGAADTTVAQLRVDALILDGFGIARIAARLFGTRDLPAFDAAGNAGAAAPPGSANQLAADRVAAERWWRATLAGASAPPALPWLTPPDRIKTCRRARRTATLNAAELTALGRVGRSAGLTANSLLATLLLDTVARWTPTLSLCVALPVAAPQRGPLGNASGFIALAHDARPGTLPGRAAALQAAVTGGLSRLAFSGVDLTRLLLAAGAGRVALPVVLTNGLGWDAPEADAPMRLTDGLTQTPQVALDLRLSRDAAGGLNIAADYAVDALDPRMVEEMLAAAAGAMRAVAAAGALPDELPEPAGVAGLAAGPAAPEPAMPIPFLSRIAANLDNPAAGVALCHGGQQISYAALGADIRSLMAGLRARGLCAGSVLAICLPRGPDHLALQLAAAFQGVIWVPIDAAAPPERRDWLIAQCRADLVISDAVHQPGLPANSLTPDALRGLAGKDADAADGVPDFDADTLDTRSVSAGIAYRLFTSGTTGRPKCVALSNLSTANTIGATLARWKVGPGDVVMSVTPLHHDMSVFDLFGTLAAGATLVMPDPGADKDAAHWADLVAAHRVTLWVSVPAIVDMLLLGATDPQLASLRLIAQGGDYIRPAAVAALRRRLPGCRLVSLGGPTETTIWSIWHDIGPLDREVIPYGRALPGNHYHVLDPLGRPCPVGVTGRIHSTGINLAPGYWQENHLIQTDFIDISTPTGPQRAFRSGDLGWRRADGAIIFAGRVDGYLKVRGVRVSLPYIADELASHPRVVAALVVDYPDPVGGETMIGAAYVARGGLDAGALRDHLRRRLPASHLPSRLIALPALPLSANGKPDRAAIRKLMVADRQPSRPDAAPRSDARPRPPSAGHGPKPAIAAPPDSGRVARVSGLCAQVLGLPPDQVSGDSALLWLGLLPHHLAALAEGLARPDGRKLAPGALAHCRTPAQIAEVAS